MKLHGIWFSTSTPFLSFLKIWGQFSRHGVYRGNFVLYITNLDTKQASKQMQKKKNLFQKGGVVAPIAPPPLRTGLISFKCFLTRHFQVNTTIFSCMSRKTLCRFWTLFTRRDRYLFLYTAKTGVLNLTPVGVNRGPHPQVLTLHRRVST